ncbi:MAG: hypothetical protein M0D54_03430 [Hyphomonadaceae bacterium JAD_PAG50586_4]|nr:MAG: hypothetical protein M0D54_03430 [Hyphomonadaceae bacterium JAD_PAG50586_4]
MTRDELVTLVERVNNGEGSTDTGNELVDRLDAAIPNGDIFDLIFWPPTTTTAEQVVDEALLRSETWRRIQL